MIFIILIVLGLLGMGITLYVSNGAVLAKEYGTEGQEPWYVLHPENFESGLSSQVRTLTRKILKVMLLWMIEQYRKLSEKITVKQVVKARIRNFLYEHDKNAPRQPSEFWTKVRHPKKSSTAKRKHATAASHEAPAEPVITELGEDSLER